MTAAMVNLVRLVGALNLLAGIVSLPGIIDRIRPLLFPPANPMGEDVPVQWALPLFVLFAQAVLSILSILGGFGVFLFLRPARWLLLTVAPLHVVAAAFSQGWTWKVVSLVLTLALAGFTMLVLLSRRGRETFMAQEPFLMPEVPD